jgi:hypothetical protein
MEKISEYSEYEFNSLNYFCDKIEMALNDRDLPGLFNNKIEKIVVSKEHPLITYIASTLLSSKTNETQDGGLLPAIGVTPGSNHASMETFAKNPVMQLVDDQYIAKLKEIRALDFKERKKDGLITDDQIDNILLAYRKKGTTKMFYQRNSWGWDEEVNVSCWSDNIDRDRILAMIVDSTLARLTIEQDSPVRNMKYSMVNGLTNFNYGRILFGTEFNLTFFNRYSISSIYTEEHITDVTFVNTFRTPSLHGE